MLHHKLYKHFTITSTVDWAYFTTPHITIGWDENSWRGISFNIFFFDLTFHYNGPEQLTEWETDRK